MRQAIDEARPGSCSIRHASKVFDVLVQCQSQVESSPQLMEQPEPFLFHFFSRRLKTTGGELVPSDEPQFVGHALKICKMRFIFVKLIL